MLHNWTEHVGIANGTGSSKTKVTAHGEVHALFKIDGFNYRIVVERYYCRSSSTGYVCMPATLDDHEFPHGRSSLHYM